MRPEPGVESALSGGGHDAASQAPRGRRTDGEVEKALTEGLGHRAVRCAAEGSSAPSNTSCCWVAPLCCWVWNAGQ